MTNPLNPLPERAAAFLAKAWTKLSPLFVIVLVLAGIIGGLWLLTKLAAAVEVVVGNIVEGIGQAITAALPVLADRLHLSQLQVGVGAVVCVVAVYLLWIVPRSHAETLRAKGESDSHKIMQLENELRRTLATIFGGVFLLLGVYLTYENLIASQEKQNTESFAKAVEQIGHDKLEVRLGGAYTLERLAANSQTDRKQTVELLSAFVRENAAWSKRKDLLASALPIRPAADIQAVMTILGRRKLDEAASSTQVAQIVPFALYLYETDLRGIMLLRANFDQVNFAGAHFDHATIWDSSFRRAWLPGAQMDRADFSRALLEGANLEGAMLRGAKLAGAKLAGANLKGADLEGADLTDSDFSDADCSGANLKSADLTGAQHWSTNFQNANLAGVKGF